MMGSFSYIVRYSVVRNSGDVKIYRTIGLGCGFDLGGGGESESIPEVDGFEKRGDEAVLPWLARFFG
jgi:hypothetical protein